MSQASFPMTPAFEPGPPVYFDANPLSDRHLTGIGRYEARLALAMAARRPVRFFKQDQLVEPPADMNWSQDQDLGAWARTLMSGEKVPFDPAAEREHRHLAACSGRSSELSTARSRSSTT